MRDFSVRLRLLVNLSVENTETLFALIDTVQTSGMSLAWLVVSLLFRRVRTTCTEVISSRSLIAADVSRASG